ncbi:MAG TPA: type IV pilus assembly protein PilM [Verrucomicrobiae bacterium]|nr:type IV pilus assembly protein PilM [Verrucomicrobiae bacterium]
MFRQKKDVVGIDIGSSSIKLVQLKEQKGAYQLQNLAIMTLPAEAIVDNTIMDTAGVVEAIKNLVRSVGSKAKEASCSISGNSVIIRKISFPTMTAEELEDQIQWEAEQYIPFDINDVNMDFQVLSHDVDDPSKMNVLLVASKKDIINDYLSVFAEAGLKLSVVDVDAFAVQNAFEMNYDTLPDEIVALVNIGASIMNINIVRGGTSLFTRDVQVGGNLYTEEIQKFLGVSTEEAENIKITMGSGNDAVDRSVINRTNDMIALEMHRSIDFFNSSGTEDKISKVYLSGGCAKTSFLLDTVRERLKIPVEIIDPIRKVKFSQKEFDEDYLKSVAPLVAVAVGLAARRAGDK